MKNVIAVYGALRSGTTLLRLMLDGNSNLRCPGETDFLFDHLRLASDGSWYYDRKALEHDRIYRAHCQRFGDAPEHALSLEEMVARMGREGNTVVLMVHRNLDKLLTCFPDIRILHLVRDPRDVARSSVVMGWAGSPYFGIGHWIKTETSWEKGTSEIDAGQILALRYEDLIIRPKEYLTLVCAFAGVSYEPGMLEYDTDTTYSKPDASLIFQWKTKQTPREIGLVEGRLGDLLQIAGYEPSGHPPVFPRGIEKMVLSTQNRLAIWRVRTKRYGFLDPVLVRLAARLRIPALGYGAKLRMGRKAVKYLK